MMSERDPACPSNISAPYISTPVENQTVLQRFVVTGGGQARYRVRLRNKDETKDISGQMHMGGWGQFTLHVNQDFATNQYVEFRVLLWGDDKGDFCVHKTRPLRKVWMHGFPQPVTPPPGATIAVDQVFEGKGGYRGKEIRLTSEDRSEVFGFDIVSETGTWLINPDIPLPLGTQQLALVQDEISEGEEPNVAKFGGCEVFEFKVVGPDV
ncbi:hypothetical protein ACYZTM_10775 [Pseudomonas sp. MDT2-39-1]